MKTHTTLGRDAIQHAEDTLGLEVEFLRVAKEIAYCHQEKWDGSGYPNGLQGERIPLSARMMAVADVYDALISTRVYKTGLSHEQAVRLILDSRGRHFDPDVADAFEAVAETFRAIALRFADEDMPTA
jgi:putative two-component system response regulator